MMHAYLATLLLPSTATCAGWNAKRRCYQRKNNRPWLAYGKYRFTSSGLRFTPKRGWQLCVWPGHYSHIITPTHAWQGDGLAWPMLTHYHKFPCGLAWPVLTHHHTYGYKMSVWYGDGVTWPVITRCHFHACYGRCRLAWPVLTQHHLHACYGRCEVA